MKKPILFVFAIMVCISFVYAACDDTDKQDDWCFGTKVYTHKCNGSDWDAKVKGDCGALGQICRNAECITADECDINSDCSDGLPCTTDSCVGDSVRRCEYETNQGCEFSNRCIPVGSRLDENDLRKFCEFDGSLLEQKQDKKECNNNYECQSNSCSKGVCTNNSYEVRDFLLGFILVINLFIILILYLKKKK